MVAAGRVDRNFGGWILVVSLVHKEAALLPDLMDVDSDARDLLRLRRRHREVLRFHKPMFPRLNQPQPPPRD